MNFDIFPCLAFFSQNVFIPTSPKIFQWTKCLIPSSCILLWDLSVKLIYLVKRLNVFVCLGSQVFIENREIDDVDTVNNEQI